MTDVTRNPKSSVAYFYQLIDLSFWMMPNREIVFDWQLYEKLPQLLDMTMLSRINGDVHFRVRFGYGVMEEYVRMTIDESSENGQFRGIWHKDIASGLKWYDLRSTVREYSTHRRVGQPYEMHKSIFPLRYYE